METSIYTILYPHLIQEGKVPLVRLGLHYHGFHTATFAQWEKLINLNRLLYLIETQGNSPCTFYKITATGKLQNAMCFPAQENVLRFSVCAIKNSHRPKACTWIKIQLVQLEQSEFPSMQGHCGCTEVNLLYIRPVRFPPLDQHCRLKPAVLIVAFWWGGFPIYQVCGLLK